VYGAFVSWAALSRPIRSAPIVKRAVANLTAMPAGPGVAVLTAVIVLTLSGAAWFLTSTTAVTGAVAGILIVFVGAAIGIGYLIRQVVLVVREPIS
jgi:hypothetical protein